jgi:hypothetical protein
MIHEEFVKQLCIGIKERSNKSVLSKKLQSDGWVWWHIPVWEAGMGISQFKANQSKKIEALSQETSLAW